MRRGRVKAFRVARKEATTVLIVLSRLAGTEYSNSRNPDIADLSPVPFYAFISTATT